MNRNFWGGSARLRPLLWRVGLFLLLVSVVSAQTIWTERHRRAGGALWGIAEGNAGIVAVGEAGRVLFSLDGTAWSSVPSGTSAWLVAVCGGAGEFVAVGDFGTILRSANGLDWTLAKSVPTRARLNNVAYEDGQYVVVGEGGVILYSNDGDTWFETSSGVTGWLRGLTRVNGMWVAGGQKGPLVVSFDGKVWTKKPGLDFDIEGLVPGLDLIGDPSAPVRYIRYVGESGQVGQVLLTIGGGMIYYRLAPWYICSHTVTPSRLLTLVNLNQKVVVAGENGEVYLTKLPLNNGVFARAILPTAATFLGSGIARNCVWLVGSDETILQSEPAAPTRLVNLSTRGVVGKRGQPMIAGTVVTGDTMREFLVRGVGPGLRPFVGDAALERADLSVYRADGSLSFFCRGGDKLPIEEATRISSNVGAFPLSEGSLDSSLSVWLAPGRYTFHLSHPEAGEKVGLVEIFDGAPWDDTGSRLSNVSTLGWVGQGADVLIGGFVLKGPGYRRVLIRGVGPTLTDLSVPDALTDPVIKLYRGSTLLAENDDWATGGTYLNRLVTADDLVGEMAKAGAFALPRGSKDAVIIATLQAGSYTLHVEGKGGQEGAAIVEIYELP